MNINTLTNLNTKIKTKQDNQLNVLFKEKEIVRILFAKAIMYNSKF